MKKCVLFLAVMLALALALSVTALAEETPAELVTTELPAQEAAPIELIEATDESPVQEATPIEPIGAIYESPVDEVEKTYPVEEPLSEIVGGESGENGYWTLDPNSGVLTIYGTECMNHYINYDYNGHSVTSAPWGKYYSYIKSVSLESGALYIGDCAFYGCSSLRNVNIPKSVTTIGNDAFNGCLNLASVVFGGNTLRWNAVSIGQNGNDALINAQKTFNNSDDYEVGGKCGTNVSWSFNAASGKLTISGSGAMLHYYQHYGVYYTTTAPWGSFYQSIRSVVIEDGVTTIGTYAFYGCSNLTSVEIPKSILGMGDNAFNGCSSLKDVYYGGNELRWQLVIISQNGNVALSNMRIHYNQYDDFDGTIGGLCGVGVTWTLNITTGELTISGTGAMYNYYYANNNSYNYNYNYPQKRTSAAWGRYDHIISSITISDGVTSIGNYVFCGCTQLTNVTISNSVTAIGDYAFDGCKSLTSFEIPNSVTSIGSYAFDGCRSLTRINITDIAAWCKISLANNYSNPLFYAHNLYLNGELVTNLVIPDGVTSIGWGVFYNCTSLTSVSIPDSVTNIGGYAFYGCDNLKSVEVPNGITVIEQYVFGNCTNLTSVTIPASLRGVERAAFAGSNNITDVYYCGTKIQWKQILIFGSKWLQNAEIHYNANVPANTSSLMGDLAVTDASGNLQDSIPQGKSTVSFTLTNLKSAEGSKVMLATYNDKGQFDGVLWVKLKDVPVGAAVEVTVPIDNTSGKVSKIKAFVVSADGIMPQGNALSFGE